MVPEPAAAFDMALQACGPNGRLYVLPTYTAMLDFRHVLANRGLWGNSGRTNEHEPSGGAAWASVPRPSEHLRRPGQRCSVPAPIGVAGG